MASIIFGTNVWSGSLTAARSATSGAIDVGRGGGAIASGLCLQFDQLNSASDSPFIGWAYPGIVQIPGGLRILDVSVPIVAEGFTLIRIPPEYSDSSLLAFLRYHPASPVSSYAINVRAYFVQ